MERGNSYTFEQWPALLEAATPRFEHPIRWRQQIGARGSLFALFPSGQSAQTAGYSPLTGREVFDLSQQWWARNADSSSSAIPIFLRFSAIANGDKEGPSSLMSRFADHIDPPHLANEAKATWIKGLLDHPVHASFTGTECSNLVMFLQPRKGKPLVVKLLNEPGNAIGADHFYRTFGFETPTYVCVSATSPIGTTLRTFMLDEAKKLDANHHMRRNLAEFSRSRTHLVVMPHLVGTPFVHLHPQALKDALDQQSVIEDLGRIMVMDALLAYQDRTNRLIPNLGNFLLATDGDRIQIIDSGIRHRSQRLSQQLDTLDIVLDRGRRNFYVDRLLYALGLRLQSIIPDTGKWASYMGSRQERLRTWIDHGVRRQAHLLASELTSTERQRLATHPLGQPSPESFDGHIFGELIDQLRTTVQSWDPDV